ncbi:hypothetical protein AB6806_27895 [Bosea sp. RCC_152_1]
MVLTNRDKAQQSGVRGLDGKFIQIEQAFDSAANRRSADSSATDDAS